MDDPAYVQTLTKLGMMILANNLHTDFHTFTSVNSVILKIMYKVIDIISKMNSRDAQPDSRQASPQEILLMSSTRTRKAKSTCRSARTAATWDGQKTASIPGATYL